jgi:magnesium transporter
MDEQQDLSTEARGAEVETRLQEQVNEVHRLLDKHRLLEEVARRQETPKSALLERMQHRQNLAELHKRLRVLHPADLAQILESLPIDDRLVVWRELPSALAGPALVEVDPSVRESLVEHTDRTALLALLRELDADDLRYLAGSLPDDLVDEVSALLDARDRTWMEESRAYADSSAARLMMQDRFSLRDTQSAGDAIASIRNRGQLPSHTDRLFVVDSRNVLVGAVPLSALLMAGGAHEIASIMDADVRRFRPYDDAEEVAKAFERYDLLSAPIVDDRGKLIGRVSADAVMDVIRASSGNDVLALAGLRKAEDLFAPVWDSARNRWPWLAVNLATAFVASRVIGAFEATIQQLVALAALMPIVASIGGNTGNQTVALVVRGLALDQIRTASAWHLLRKELTVSVLNGLLWGTVMGVIAGAIYSSAALAVVMASAVVLNLIIAALVGVFVPLLLERSGRDPAQGSSVMLTFVTDGMGFFLFLGLARMFLM